MGCATSHTATATDIQPPPQLRQPTSTPCPFSDDHLKINRASQPQEVVVELKSDNDNSESQQRDQSRTRLPNRIIQNMNNINVDCGCLIFHGLTIPEAIALSQTNRFWLNISSRPPAYHPMHFPSFDEKFDIVDYRHWQRQRYAVTLIQLIRLSMSRVVQHGLHDLELIFTPFAGCSCNQYVMGRAMKGLWTNELESDLGLGLELVIDEVIQAISRLHAIEALTIHVDCTPMTGIHQFSTGPEGMMMPQMTQVQRILLTHLFAHVSSTLISFQLSIPHDIRFTQPQLRHAWSLTEYGPFFSKLRHVVFHGCENWLKLGSLLLFQPIGGVLEFIRGCEKERFPWTPRSIIPAIVCQIQNSPLAPRHLIFKEDTFRGDSRIGHISKAHSGGRLLPYQPINPIYASRPSHSNQWVRSITDLLPADDPLSELCWFVRISRTESDLRRLIRMCDSFHLRRLQMRTDMIGWSLIELVNSTLLHPSLAPFQDVTTLRLESWPERVTAPPHPYINLDMVQQMFSSLETLELHGSIHLPHQPDGCMIPLNKLRHLTTPLPGTKETNFESHHCFKRMMMELRSLESLRIIVDQKEFRSGSLEYLDLLIFSSSRLKQFTIAHDTRVRSFHGCASNRPNDLAGLNQFLVTLHLIWEMIQPTHIIPLDHINLTPTCMTDLVPLFSDFLPDPSRLPYLRHRFQRFDRSHPPSTAESTESTGMVSRLKGWLSVSKPNWKNIKQSDESYLAAVCTLVRSCCQQFRDRVTKARKSAAAARTHSLPETIETREYFKIILQLERDD